MKILFVNAMTDFVGGESFAAGLDRGLDSYVELTGLDRNTIEFVHYNLFYASEKSPIRPARLMGRFARQHEVTAVILSGSSKNTTDVGDPFLDDYFAGLKDLLGFRSGFDDWEGPKWPVLGICFGHQAIAATLGGETATFEMAWGPKKIKLLPRAFEHPMLKKFAAAIPKAAGSKVDLIVYHGDHVVRLPAGFHALMSSDYCGIQGMAHDQWPIISMQPHPESSDKLKDDPDDAPYWDAFTPEDLNSHEGWTILARFFEWASKLNG